MSKIIRPFRWVLPGTSLKAQKEIATGRMAAEPYIANSIFGVFSPCNGCKADINLRYEGKNQHKMAIPPSKTIVV